MKIYTYHIHPIIFPIFHLINLLLFFEQIKALSFLLFCHEKLIIFLSYLNEIFPSFPIIQKLLKKKGRDYVKCCPTRIKSSTFTTPSLLTSALSYQFSLSGVSIQCCAMIIISSTSTLSSMFTSHGGYSFI